jgi:hypothetical protein
LNFLNIFLKKHSNFVKIHLVGAELFHVDRQMERQTDMMKLIGASCSFAKCQKGHTGERKEVYKNTEGCEDVSLSHCLLQLVVL